MQSNSTFHNQEENEFLTRLKSRIFKIPSNSDSENIPNIKFNLNNNTPAACVSEQDLIKSKNTINNFSKNKWNFFRDLLNPYEFNNIDKIDYINRAYFKLHEIIKVFELENEFKAGQIEYSGVCEFPCGFAKCVIDVFGDKISKVNIMSNDENKPKINQDKKICIDTLDITNKEELINAMKTKTHKSMLVTSDGGINENEEYSIKEKLHYKLKLFEICTGLRLLDEGGVFILKLFDFFTIPTMEMLYLLSFYFKEVYIYKPVTSRPTNSERYVICKNRVKKECVLNPSNIPTCDLIDLKSFLKEDMPIDFVKCLRKINGTIVKTQINNINFVVSKIENNIDEKEKQYFLNKKNKEQKKFFNELNVKKY